MIDMKKLYQKAQMKTSVVAAIAIVTLVVGAVVGYFAAPVKPGEAVTVTTSAPAATQTVTKTVGTVRTPVTIKLNWWPGPESDAIGKVVDYWNKYLAEETGIKVEMVLFGREEHPDKLTSLLLAGNPEPDIVFEYYLVGKLADYLEPLDSYFNNPTLYPYTLGDFFPAAVDAFRVNGVLYGVPTDVSVHVLIYRKDLITKPPETFDELYTMAKQFTKKYNPDSPTEYGFTVSGKNLLYNAMLWGGSVLGSAGGTVFTAGNEKKAVEDLTSPAAKKALKLYVDFVQEGISPPDSVTYEYGEANAAFMAGKAAMYVQWNAAIGEVRDKTKAPLVWDKVGIAPIPGVKQTDGTTLHRSYSHYLGFSINKASTHKTEAFRFIAWLTTTKPMLMYLQNGGFPPDRAVFANDEAVKVRSEIPDLVPILNNYAFASTTHPEVFTIYTILAKHASAAWTGTETIDNALAAAQEELRGILK